MRVKSAVTGKFRTVGASVERLEWIPGEKSKVTVTMMSKSLQGEWLGSGVGNKDRYGEILTAGSSAGFSQWEHRLPQARMQD